MINSEFDEESLKNNSSSSQTLLRLENETVFNVDRKLRNDELCEMTFLLTIFDNIVGPRVVHYWTMPNSDGFAPNEQLRKYIAIHTLNGELYQEKLVSMLKFRFYLIKEIECAVFAVFFDAGTISSSSTCGASRFEADLAQDEASDNESVSSLNATQSAKKRNKRNSRKAESLCKVETTLNCISMVVPLKNKSLIFDHYGDNTRFFFNYFENIILEYKVLAQISPKVNKKTTAIDYLTQSLKKLCSDLNTMRSKSVYPVLSDPELNMPHRIHVIDTFLNDCYFTAPSFNTINNDFLVNAISSHIITNFNTIIFGKTSAPINKMIKTLALFTPKEKLKTSCYAVEDCSYRSSYFYIQGFVTENPDAFNSILDADFLFKRDSPTTVIDLCFKQVYRTSILNEFHVQRENFLQKKIQFLFNSLTLNDLNTVYPIHNYLHWVSSDSIVHKANLITVMLKQMDVLESEFGVKDSYIDLVIKDFYLMALNLIEYVNNELVNWSNRKEKWLRLSVKKVCNDLDIKTEEDLNILISYANYLKPNFIKNLLFQS